MVGRTLVRGTLVQRTFGWESGQSRIERRPVELGAAALPIPYLSFTYPLPILGG